METVEQQTNPQVKDDVFHTIPTMQTNFFSPKLIVFFAVVVVAGVAAGYFLSTRGFATTQTAGSSASQGIAKGTMYGSTDTSTFKDTATGVMKNGGINGEGQVHLERPGGDSQNVYLTSSLVDLSQFIGKKVQVWGQTQKAQSAGWLMDVGRLEVL